ncbi:MAG: NTP transferase domain-containing protein [Rickettsiales bacterium]
MGITMDELAAVILVGGKSSHMGQDKASLPYKGKRLVDVVAKVVREAGIEEHLCQRRNRWLHVAARFTFGSRPMGRHLLQRGAITQAI